ncbi:hypothetical protein [Dictyobacter kobayashii]|uniref:Uncharacterized protein n=1 Tax=Dictyobacter kobayashii TaxID=2014872 RepID=A0A402AIR9_9CHLR|nr:hypothetical protein [Dictyobacter kobayashii]GCE18996.1 hypothetical protein KDK_27960 [Dictyobacter kobayashii]
MEKIKNQHAVDPQEDVMQQANTDAKDELLENQPVAADASDDASSSDGEPEQEQHSTSDEEPESSSSSDDEKKPASETSHDEAPVTESPVATETAVPSSSPEEVALLGEDGEPLVRSEDEERLNIPEVLPILPKGYGDLSFFCAAFRGWTRALYPFDR